VKTIQTLVKGFGPLAKTFALIMECEHYSGIERASPGYPFGPTPGDGAWAEMTEPSHESTLHEAKGGLSLAAAQCTWPSAYFQQLCLNVGAMHLHFASNIVKFCSYMSYRFNTVCCGPII
jgi:hypothetical protein